MQPRDGDAKAGASSSAAASSAMAAASSSTPSTSIQYEQKSSFKMTRQYVMGDVLGEGSQGKVREALDSQSLRRVAIKIINLRQLR